MLVFIGVVAFAATFFISDLWISNGSTPMLVPALAWVVPLIIAVVLLALAWQVRRYQRGDRAVDPILAARTYVFALACSRGGAILAGVAAGLALAYAHTGPTASLTQPMWELVFVALACVALVAAALVAERWCKIDDTEDDDDAPPRGAQPA